MMLECVSYDYNHVVFHNYGFFETVVSVFGVLNLSLPPHFAVAPLLKGVPSAKKNQTSENE